MFKVADLVSLNIDFEKKKSADNKKHVEFPSIAKSKCVCTSTTTQFSLFDNSFG